LAFCASSEVAIQSPAWGWRERGQEAGKSFSRGHSDCERFRILRKSERARVFGVAMVTMSAMSRTGPLFVVPLSSLCARHAAKTCQKHGRLKPQFRLEPGARFGRARVLCGLTSSSGSGTGVWFDRALEAQGRQRRKPLLRWEEQRRWTRAWTGQNLTWNEEQSPYETLGEHCAHSRGDITSIHTMED
jgi:hypothetical protein